MKNILCAFLFLNFISCQTVQVVTVLSDEKYISKELVFENDSLRIEYRFWAIDGVVSFKIFNKLAQPIYIDWKKCSYVSGERKFDYFIDLETGSEVTYYNGFLYRGTIYSNGSQSTSTKVKAERVTFIPPKSFVTKAKFIILSNQYFDLEEEPAELVQANWTKRKKMTQIRTIQVEKATSKFQFRNFLTFSLSEKFENEFYVDNGFWLGKITEMKEKHFRGRRNWEGYSCPYQSPQNFYLYKNSEGDRTYCP
jgi:hypothetical protein